MKCQKCNENEAVFHYKQITNGEVTEGHLCNECAKELQNAGELNVNSMPDFEQGDFGFGLDGFLSHIFGGTAKLPQSDACPLCGSTAQDISRSGRVGCAGCYTKFGAMLLPYIRRIHGNTSHAGRIPEGLAGEIGKRRKLEAMRAELKTAIAEQEFERAAELRDSIRTLESESQGKEN